MAFIQEQGVEIEPSMMRADIAGFGDYSGFQGAKGSIKDGPNYMAMSGKPVPIYSVE
jgi:hypothetical protein